MAKATTSKKATVAKSAPKKSKAESRLEAFLNGDAKGKDKGKKPKEDEDDVFDSDDLDEDESRPQPVWGADVTEEEKKSIEDTYQRKTQLEHILLRPDTYIGSVEPITQQLWVYDDTIEGLQYREVKITPGLYKIFDEILVNAADNKIRDPTMDTIKVTIDSDENLISVWNNGKGIPVEIHKKEKIYVPELIFGHLLTSSNYDDTQKKVTGGRNGYGAKLCNIFSTEFTVVTADRVSGQKFKQVFKNNMSTRTTPAITPNKKKEEYTMVSFRPDLAKFHMETLDKDITALFKKRVYDLAGTVMGVKVYLNGTRIKIKNFKEYVEMYLKASDDLKTTKKGKGKSETSPVSSEDVDDAVVKKPKPLLIHEVVNSRWEIAFAVSEGQFQQVSFVNSICTVKGGTHVNHVAEQITNRLIDVIKRKAKDSTIKGFQIKNHMWLFVNCLIENPTFDSQTKESMTLRASAFGSKCEPSESFYKKILRSDIVENVLSWSRFKLDQQLKKSDGSRSQRIAGIDALEDATCAGTREAHKCTLFLTEGNSARSLAMCGFEIIGKKYYGVYPLRGKLLNVRCASPAQLLKNSELSNLKRILGLKHGASDDRTKLRYGRVMIMADQDYDGSHIKGLIINLFDYFFPSLIKDPGFLMEFVTPIVRATKGKESRPFFTIPEFEAWYKSLGPRAKSWNCKYYKGLGTSDVKDAKRYFSDLDTHEKRFAGCDNEDRRMVDMVFNSTRSDERKEWLRQFQPGTYLDHTQDNIRVSEFINRELILFSMADNIRSIPSVVDGFKPAQRKALYGCIKNRVTKEKRVSQLASQVAADTNYHHGEESLNRTIISMAQDFVGSNNVNLLQPNGQFGTRVMGGEDAAASRYLHTLLGPLARIVFNPQDDHLLNYLQDESHLVEPEWYSPVIPIVLLNNATGIGTGWSTNIPCYNPVDIVNNIRHLMNGEEMSPMTPWYRGFKGEIIPEGPDKFRVTGIVRKVDDTTLEVTELPIGMWNDTYKKLLEGWCTGTDKVPAFLKDFFNYSGVYTVLFEIKLSEAEMAKAEAEGLEKRLRLTTTISTSNMICFDRHGRIKKYHSPLEIIQDFYDVRIEFYQKRKDWLIDQLTQDWARLDNCVRFILEIIEKKLVVQNRKKKDIIADLDSRGYTRLSRRNAGKNHDLSKRAVSNEEEEEGNASEEEGVDTKTQTRAVDQDSQGNFDYLLSMPIWSLTRERVEKMLRERDEKQSDLDVLLKTSPMELWNRDLDAFLEGWEKKMEKHAEEEQDASDARAAHEQRGKGGKGKAQAKPKVKKRIASEDEFEEGSSTLAKKVPRKKATKVKAEPTLVDDDDDFDQSSRTNARPKTATAIAKAKIKPKSTTGASKQSEETGKDASKDSKLDGFFSKKAKDKPPAVTKVPLSDEGSDDDLSLSLTARMNKLLAARKRKSSSDNSEGSDQDDGGAFAKAVVVPVKSRKTLKTGAGGSTKRVKTAEVDVTRSAVIVNDGDGDSDSDVPIAFTKAKRPSKTTKLSKSTEVSSDDEIKEVVALDDTLPSKSSAHSAKAGTRGRGRGRGRGATANGNVSRTKVAKKTTVISSASEAEDDDDDDIPIRPSQRPSRGAR
ncbi:DNA topoisomerase 2, partial [Dispira simplex]